MQNVDCALAHQQKNVTSTNKKKTRQIHMYYYHHSGTVRE